MHVYVHVHIHTYMRNMSTVQVDLLVSCLYSYVCMYTHTHIHGKYVYYSRRLAGELHACVCTCANNTRLCVCEQYNFMCTRIIQDYVN
jgi:hypothetical protein